MANKKNTDEGICGHCHHHRYNPDTKEWVCLNRESDNYAVETEYNDSCIDFEERMDHNQRYKCHTKINKKKRDKARAFMEEDRPRISAIRAMRRKPYESVSVLEYLDKKKG